jgi:ligand-binding sensor domain-containing protein/signal transduction histidine kinase
MAVRRPSSAFLFLTMALAARGANVATDQEYSRRVWQSDDGLPQNRVQALSQTGDGYLWIGTSGGLVRFDGIRFVVFDRSTTPALGDDSILTLCAARDGGLWIGTEGGGLVYMKAGVFRSFGTAQGLTNPFVRAIAEGRSGELWVGTDRGIFRRDSAQSGHFIRLDGPTGAGKGIRILAGSSILQDRTGAVWVGTTSGLYSLAADQLTAEEGFRIQGAVRSLLEDPDGTLWVSSGAGLWRIRNGRAEPPRPTDPKNPRILCRDHDGNLWVSSAGDGLVRLSPNGASSAFRSETLPDTSVLSLFEDREQNLWVGTLDGLLRLTRSAVRTVSAADGLAEDNVVSVSEDPAGRLWIGTANGQLYNLEDSPRGLIVIPFHLPAAAANFRARSIFTDRAGNQWFASAGQGFLRIAAGRLQVFTVREGLRSNNTRYFLEDRNGDVWIATGSGLSRWSANAPLRTYYLEDGLAYGSIFVLAEDRNGDILVGTEGGLNRVHEGVFVADPVFTRLGNERIRAIHVDPSGSLWLGTRGDGLVRIRNGKITRFTAREGLLSNTIHQILADGDRFWMSSAAGVFVVERRDLDAVADGRSGPIAVIPYGTDSGMRSSQMNGGTQSAGCRTRAGVFWFSSVKGAVRIDPRQLRAQVASPVLIESILADDSPIPLGKDITIPPGRGKLEIGYTAPDFLSPDRVTFRYRLEGFDVNWTPSTRGRAAYYTNLPPGRYRFHVVARDAARPEMTSEAVLPIVWQAHFYQSAWFFALLAVLTGLAIWSVFRLYARQTKARYALVLAERTRLAREMHDTVIQGCVGVSTLLEAARSMPASAKDKAAELVERAAVQVRVTVNEARDAVWDLRHSAIGHEDEQATDLVQTLESFARQVESSEGISVRTEFNGLPASLGNVADRNLLLVAREAIRNAVTHAHAACIQLKVRFEPGEVRLEVSDDGRGFNPAASRDNGHYGIIGMRERVEQSGGVFQMISSPGQGTSVRAVLPAQNPPAPRKKT